jgi:hypothetical protein
LSVNSFDLLIVRGKRISAKHSCAVELILLSLIGTRWRRCISQFLLFDCRDERLTRKDHLEIVKVLRAYRADLAQLTSRLQSPLHLAACCSPRIVGFLVAEGVTCNDVDAYGFTPLHLAARYQLKDAEDLLAQRIQSCSAAPSIPQADVVPTSVYVCGSTADGRLGMSDDDSIANTRGSIVSVPSKLDAVGKNVVVVSCGVQMTCALTSTGEVLAWGNGQCKPERIQVLLRFLIVDVCCGSNHTAAVDALGNVYTWGDGAMGRLGHGDEFNAKSPRQVESFRVIASLLLPHLVRDRQLRKLAAETRTRCF